MTTSKGYTPRWRGRQHGGIGNVHGCRVLKGPKCGHIGGCILEGVFEPAVQDEGWR